MKSEDEPFDYLGGEETTKIVRSRRPIRSRVYYQERRKRVAELRVIGNLTFEQIGQRITAYGFEPVTTERAWRDYQLYMAECTKALNAVDQKAEVVARLEGLFALAIMAYKDAERQEKDGRRSADPYARALLLQRATDIAVKLGELVGAFADAGKPQKPDRIEIAWVGYKDKPGDKPRMPSAAPEKGSRLEG